MASTVAAEDEDVSEAGTIRLLAELSPITSPQRVLGKLILPIKFACKIKLTWKRSNIPII